MAAAQEKILTVPKDHNAAIFDKPGGPVSVRTVPVVQQKDLKVGEALVKVLYTGVCHTDLHAMLGDWPLPTKLPLVGGHEGAGVIVAINDNTPTHLKIGDRVGIKWLADSCLHCEFCRKGFEPVCPEAKNSGYTVDGSFQQFAVSYTDHLTLIPDNVPLQEAAPVLCAGVTVYKAIKETKATPGDWIVIPGAGGGLGHLAVQYARYVGLRVIAVDTGAEKKKLTEELGAEAWIDFKETKDIVSEVKKIADGLGSHCALVAAASPGAYEQALEYLRPFGTLVAVGLGAGAEVKANVFWTVLRGIRVVGSIVGNRQDAVEALDIVSRGHVKTFYKVLPMSQLPQVFEDMHQGKLVGRIVLDNWK